MPSSAKLEMGFIPSPFEFCVLTLSSRFAGEAALLRFPIDITFFRIFDMVVVLELELGNR